MDRENSGKDTVVRHTFKTKFHETHHRTKERTSSLLQTKRGKVLIGGLVLLVILAILFAIPLTRYGILGAVVKKDVTVTIIDSKTKKPVSEATVTIGGVSAQSDKDGVANVGSVPVNDGGIDVAKQYYTSAHQDFTVPVLFSPEHAVIELDAQGRLVTVSAVDKITDKALADVTIDSDGIKSISDKFGLATMILPPEKDNWSASISRPGYNRVNVQLKDNSDGANDVALTPAGSIVYLSKASGKINVMRSDIDGGNTKVIVKATGQEGDNNTSLLASRDWSYAVLLATREDDKQRVYLVDVAKGKLSLIDQGDADFTLVGWSGHNFIYTVYRSNLNSWDSKHESLKSFNADTRTLSTLDDTRGGGSNDNNYEYEYLNQVYLLEDEAVYVKNWSQSDRAERLSPKYPYLVSVKVSTGNKRTVKDFIGASSAELKTYEPQGLYLRVWQDGDSTFYEYQNGVVKSVSGVSVNTFYDFYPTYLVSPSGNKVFWYEERDGKNVLLIGNKEGKDSRIISPRSEYLPYGWFGKDDQYILLSKDGSELYIADANADVSKPLWITGYHKTRSYLGYGYGYGGL